MSEKHPFTDHPHRTIVALSVPTLLSLIAEPLTGLVDTIFITQLGATPLAAIGVGVVVLSSVFWIFNFLAISTQTEVAQLLGRGEEAHSAQVMTLALVLAAFLSVPVIGLLYPLAGWIASVGMGAEPDVATLAGEYVRIRLWGTPAFMVTLVAFGALRGMQDMQTPLWIAAGLNAVNIVLDAVLIFGLGPFPELGTAGSALATSVAQWFGAGWAIWAVGRRLGFSRSFRFRDSLRVLQVGGDLFIRTGMLTLFLLVATRVANQIGAEAGAAHQAIRQVWFFTAMLMDAFAMTAQSLTGYFLGANDVDEARHVAVETTRWSLVTGFVLMLLMLAGTSLAPGVIIPPESVGVFGPAWLAAALIQPMNSLAFITDGIHWGTGDFRYLRNGMILAAVVGVGGLLLIDVNGAHAFTWVWVVSALWTITRAVVGVVRIWPGVGHSPLRPAAVT